MILTDLQFLGGAHHPGGRLAAQLGGLDLKVAGQHGTGQRNHDLITLVEIFSAADDIVHFTCCTSAHLAATEAIGIGVLSILKHLSDHDVVELWRAEFFDFFDIESQERQDFLQHFR